MGAIGSFLYNLIVTPLIYLVELVFALLYRAIANPGLAIIGVSLVVNFLCLPLYRMADRLQEEERQRQASMSKWVSHIKRHFKGDEQYMMLTTYYRQQGYKPIQALNSSISLLLQIPIFMAAYNYLSNLSILKGAPFLVFSDLGAPDALFSVGGFAVNVLPIAMTLLNCVSTFIYTKGLGLRDKLQAYGLALVFLVLLYDSPSGLVMYWTCNQIFSVCKNIVFKRGAGANNGAHLAQEAEAWSPTPTFLLATLLIVALGGVLIPSALISSSAKEFINEMDFVNPLRYVGYVATVLCGFFLLWVGVFFYLSKRRGRERFALVLTVLAVVFLVDYFFFGKNLGIITSSLIFENEPQYSLQTLAVNTALVLMIPVAVWLLWKHQRQIINPVLGIAMVATLVMAFPNLSVINQAAKDTQANLQEVMAEAEREEEAEAAQEAASKEEGETTPTIAAADASYVDTFYDEDGNVKKLITLSREGKNVVVLFMDRAIGAYVPYLINEKPELKELLDGFTFYPNTISFGHFTVFGSPALYGGYDYTVEAMNARSDKLLRDKHDEALQVMPALFSQNGYDVTLFNPPLVGYHYYSNEYTLYDSYQNVDAYNVTWAYANRYFSEYTAINKQNFKRNMCFYSLFKMVPVALQGPLYDGGVYFSTAVNHTVDEAFIENYAVVASLKDLVTIDEGASNHLFIMGNCMTHNPDLLQMPNYTPSLYVDNTAYEDPSRFVLDGQEMDVSTDRLLMHYHANMAALLRLGEWFDYLREQGVYDNTRIIIVADHGAEFEQFSNMVFDDGAMNVEAVNPLFMVKDFNAHGFSTSDEFMTNADTPTIAMAGLIANPVNPFTGNPVNNSEKTAHPQLVTTSSTWETGYFWSKTAFVTEDGNWYTVHDNIFDANNWQRVD